MIINKVNTVGNIFCLNISEKSYLMLNVATKFIFCITYISIKVFFI